MKDEIVITKDAIIPVLNMFETQIILQRHCNYDKLNGKLLNPSIKEQEQIVVQFLERLKLPMDNIYFLFITSNTLNGSGERRCVDTTNIAMYLIQSFLESKGISKNHIINLDENLNYSMEVKQTDKFSEPRMFTDKKGYIEFLKEKNNGINQQFWIDFEEDRYQNERERLHAEGPDEIVSRGVYYIHVIQKFSRYFHQKKPNSKLVVWCGTHYDLISPLAKQTIFNYDKRDVISVDYCGGVSFVIDQSNNIMANVNGQFYPTCFEDIKQLDRHL